VELNSLSRSGASLRYHIKAFALKFPKSLMPQEKLGFLLSTVKCNLCLALSLHPKHLRDTGSSACSPVFSKMGLSFCLLTALTRLTYVSALSFCAGMGLLISIERLHGAESPFVLAHIRNYFIKVDEEESWNYLQIS